MNKIINTLRSIAVFIIALTSNVLYASDQIPDFIIYNNTKYYLSTYYPTPGMPLEIYFHRTDKKNNFIDMGTGLHRKHIATWEIRNNKLYLADLKIGFTVKDDYLYELKETDITSDTFRSDDYRHMSPKSELKSVSFDTYSISSLHNYPKEYDGSIFANWYSGVLIINLSPVPDDEFSYELSDSDMYIHIRDGVVVNEQIITNNDYRRMQNMTKNDSLDAEFIERYKIYEIYNSFNRFYWNAESGSLVKKNGKYYGHIYNDNVFKQLTSYYDNNPLKFPYNWENAELSGHPKCEFSISSDSIFLDSIKFVFRTSYSGPDSIIRLPLSALFDKKQIANNKVFAYWINGDMELCQKHLNVSLDCRGDKYIYFDHGQIVNISTHPSDYAKEKDSLSIEICDTSNIYNREIPYFRYYKHDNKNTPQPNTLPKWIGDNISLKEWFSQQELTDERIKNKRFGMVVCCTITCEGKAVDWKFPTAVRGELFELGMQVFDVIRKLPQNWTPATDKAGRYVDCMLEMRIEIKNGKLKYIVIP
ncbi:MAG: hypothetical protein IKY22_03260 [Bacteroidales bacterium]|nr:hypothetical protein [Bacteroidales bacterium]